MKKLLTSVLCFFICLQGSAQGVEKRYFENNPDLGGDVAIKSSSAKVENNKVFKTFEIESLEDGVYYVDAWMMAPLTKEGYPEYAVAVNGVLTGFTFKPQTDGWQGLALTDAKKSVAAVKIKKGINEISVIGKGPEIPHVEFIKLSSNFGKTGISDSNYKKFVESIKSNTFNEIYYSNQPAISSGRGTNGEIYDYCLDLHVPYSTYMFFHFSAGENVNISTMSGNLTSGCNPVIDFFNYTNPETYSWRTTASSGLGVMTVTIPVSGTYMLYLHLDPSNPNYGGPPFGILFAGFVDLGVNNNFYPACVTTTSPLRTISANYPTPANFFTCKLSSGGDTWLWLEDSSGKIRAFNDEGGTTSDGYSWGSNSRITTSLSNISGALVSGYSSYNLSFTCDLYMGLEAPSYYYQYDYPNFTLDNSFASGNWGWYNCVDWSVGITGPPNNVNYFYKIADWDAFYNYHGYTRDGANENNAAIALWGVVSCNNDTIFRHASVRKSSKSQYPHGFEWESKDGVNKGRIMHTRDALAQYSIIPCPEIDPNFYGIIQQYYRPIPEAVNYSLPVTSEILTFSDLSKLTTLKNNIPSFVITDFDMKYNAWKKTWNRPDIAIHNDPFMYAISSEYESILRYCMKYGKAVWPLIMDRLAEGDIFVISLLRDLTYNGSVNFVTEIIPSVTGGSDKPFPSLYFILVNYCKGLLAKEEVNIQNAIKDISKVQAENFEVNVNVHAQEILLNLNLIRDEKISVKIHNVFGGLEYESGYNLPRGEQRIAINTSNFKKGIHIVQITISGESISQTISI